MFKKITEQEKEIVNTLSQGVTYTVTINPVVNCKTVSRKSELNELGVWKYFNEKKNKGVLTSILDENELEVQLELIFGKDMVVIRKSIKSPFQGLPI